MELHASKDRRKELERGCGVSGLKEYPAWHTGCEHQPTPCAVSFHGRGLVDESGESVLRTDSSLVVPGNRHRCTTTVVEAVPPLHQRGAVPRQCGQLQLQRRRAEIGKAVVAWADGQCRLHLFQAD